jgi:hypothetical protein
MIDELQYIEREAREQGEADYRNEMLAKGLCFECGGEGRVPTWGTGDQAGGWAETCQECRGTGKDLRGCEWCGITHHIQQCPAIAFYKGAE